MSVTRTVPPSGRRARPRKPRASAQGVVYSSTSLNKTNVQTERWLEEINRDRWMYIFSLSILPPQAGWSRPVLPEPDWLELTDPSNECREHGRLAGDGQPGQECGCWDPALEREAFRRRGLKVPSPEPRDRGGRRVKVKRYRVEKAPSRKAPVVQLYPEPGPGVREVRGVASGG